MNFNLYVDLDIATKFVLPINTIVTENPVEGDGNCVFSAVHAQIGSKSSEPSILRSRIVQYLLDNYDYYKDFVVVENFISKGGEHYNSAKVVPPLTLDVMDIYTKATNLSRLPTSFRSILNGM